MSKITVFEKKDIGEKYYRTVHKSGLEIFLIPKDCAEYNAFFTTRYGACDNCFRLKGEKEFTKVPDGIAHYLEHKMFDNENGEDTFERFAKYGADANAFTSTNLTSYLFSCTSHFEENLEILLDYVTKPYFTPQTVQKEQGIIGQEIKMGEDNPRRMLYYNAMEAMYKDSQVKINVAGTVESISHITSDLLYSCYNTFYNLSNMFLTVSGNTTMEDILKVCDKVLPIKPPVEIERHYNEEQNCVNKKRVTAQFEISRPMFIIGIKNPNLPKDAVQLMKDEAGYSMLFDLLFGSTSDFAIEMEKSGLVNGFRASFDSGMISSYGSVSGESDNPEKVYDKVTAYIEEVKKNGFSKADFDRIKKAKYAEYIRTFDTSNIAEPFLFCKLEGEDLFEMNDYIKEVRFEDMEVLLNRLFVEEHYCMSVVEPIKK